MAGPTPDPPPQSAALPRPSPDAVYAAVAGRRTQFDGLVWQVPVLSLTAQAFLFTIALAADTTQIPRSIACVLSIVTSFLTVQILTRHRQAEITDAHLLADIETAAGVMTVHGADWRTRRNVTSLAAGIWNILARLPGFRTWAIGLALFGIAAAVVLALTWVAPSTLS